MSIDVSLHVDCPVPIDDSYLENIRKAVIITLDESDVFDAAVTVIISDHSTVHDLNRRFLDHDYETDVLSFVLTEGDMLEGEVYVDAETAHERHAEFGVTFESELIRYAIHGTLHLTGLDDATAAERSAMRAREDKVLEALDLSG